MDLSNYAHRIARAKTRVRSDLSIVANDWQRHGYAERTLPPRLTTASMPDRVDRADLSVDRFREEYERKGRPVIIRNVTKGWRAVERWTLDALERDWGEDGYFKVGESDSGRNVRLKMKHYAKYCREDAVHEDSPLYIFDDEFGEQSRCLEQDYVVPEYFREDLFELVGERRRPPHKWMVLGPARSGTSIHIDPLGTSAWNTLIHGHKRWILFPPGVDRRRIKCASNGGGSGQAREGISWFHNVLPSITESEASSMGMLDFLQAPGECVFVPGGWWHVVVNLDMTVAVTHNLCSPTTLEYVWMHTRDTRPRLAQRLLREMRVRAQHSTYYAQLVDRVLAVRCVPSLPPDSSDGSSSSSSSSSSSCDNDIVVSDTASESDRDGTCMCRRCKLKRKRVARRRALGLPDRMFCIYDDDHR